MPAKAISVFLAFCLLQNSQAQTDSKPASAVLGLGTGYGSANGVCIPCGESATMGGLSFAAELGARFKSKWKAAFEIYYWTAKPLVSTDEYGFPDETVGPSRMMLLLTGSYLPIRHQPLYLKVGGGWGNHFATPSQPVYTDQGDSTLSSFVTLGFTTVMQAGYEIHVSNAFYIVPQISWYQTWLGNLKATTGQTLHNETPSRIWDISVRFILHRPYTTGNSATRKSP